MSEKASKKGKKKGGGKGAKGPSTAPIINGNDEPDSGLGGSVPLMSPQSGDSPKHVADAAGEPLSSLPADAPVGEGAYAADGAGGAAPVETPPPEPPAETPSGTNGTHEAPFIEQIDDVKPAAATEQAEQPEPVVEPVTVVAPKGDAAVAEDSRPPLAEDASGLWTASASGEIAGVGEGAAEEALAQSTPEQAVETVPEPAAEDPFAQIGQQTVDAAPAAEDAFAAVPPPQADGSIPEQADPFEQVAPQQPANAAPEQEAMHAQAPFDVASNTSHGVPLSQDDPSKLFGDSASEFDTVEPAVFAPTVDVQAANDFGIAAAGIVEIGSPQKDPSALFGSEVPGSNDFFSTLAPPVGAPPEQQAEDPVAHAGAQPQQQHDSQWTPADAQQNAAYFPEQTPNVLPPNDLFGASSVQHDPFAQPEQHFNMQGNTQTMTHTQPADASELFGGASAPVDDAFSQVAAAQEGEAAFDPFQAAQQTESHAQGTDGLFGGQEVQDASSLFGAAPVATAADGGDVSNLFGPPTAMPDIFGTPSNDDPFGGIGVNHEASFFDSLAAAPAPVAQAVGYDQLPPQQQQQQQYAYEQPAYHHVAQNADNSAAQYTPAGQAQSYYQTPAQDNNYAQQYGQAQDYGHAHDYSQPFAQTYTQPGPFDGQAGGDDPFAQIAQQQQQQQPYQHDAQAVSGYPGAVPQQDTTSWQPYYELPATEAPPHQCGTGSYEMQAQQYTQEGTQYQQDVLPDASTQQAHYSREQYAEQHAEMLQQGVQAAFEQGAFQQPDNDTDSTPQATPEVPQGLADDLPFPWQAHVDPGSGCIYYFNTQTGVSSWEPPGREEEASEAPPQDWLNDPSTQQTLQGNEQHYAYQEQQQHNEQAAQQQQQQAQHYGQADQGAYDYGQADQGAHNYGQTAQGAYNYAQAPGTTDTQQAVAHNYGQADPAAYQQAPSQALYPAMGQQGTGVQQAQVYGQQYNAGYGDVMQQQQQQQQQQPMMTGGRGGYTGNIMMPTAAASAQSYGQAPPHDYSSQQPQAMHGVPQPMHGGGMQGDAAPRRPPCAAMCFGFGGQLVVAMPGARRSLGIFTGNAQELDTNRPMVPPPVSIYKMQTMVSQAALYRQLEAFPGPLSNTAASKKAVKAYIEEQVQNPNNSEEDLSVNPGTMRLLWEVLGIMVDCNGDLSAGGETSKVVGTERIVELLKDPNFSGDQFLNSGGGAGGFNAMGMPGGVMDPANRLMLAAPVNDVQAQQALQDMQELLLKGKREEACQKALENELWAPALLLSSYMNIDMYQKVMGEFARRSFKVGTPLRTLYMLFAGQGKHLFDPDTLEPLLDAWQANLSMLLHNRTPGDTDVLVNMGEGLWKLRKDVEAAHVCMMLAGEEIQAADAPTCRMALIGADHRANPASFCTAAALQRTEIWEFAVKLKTPKKEMPVAMSYKMHYAMMLAESGSKEKALAYLESLSVALQGGMRVPPKLQADIEMLEHRLRICIGGKAAAGSSAFKGSFFGGLRKVLDTAVSSAIYGSSAGGVPGGVTGGAVPAPPAQAPSDKVRALQAAAAEKERQAKFKAQQELEKKREAEEKKRAEKEAKEAEKKAKQGDGKKDDEEKKGMLGKLWGAIAGEKQADLGEENTMYYNEQLGRWVEKGKEHEVEAEAANAPPPTMATFVQPAQSAEGTAGGMPMGTPNGAGMPGMPGMPMGMGTPGGGNMFARQSRSGARSRYVDTLNPNASDATPTGGGMGGGMPMGGMGGGMGAAKPKPQYKIFVPQAQTQSSGDGGQASGAQQ